MRRILIVEDDPATRRLLRTMLEGEYEVLESETATCGAQVALQSLPDAILLDLSLPDAQGPETCLLFCAAALARSSPVVVISGSSADEMRGPCLSFGACAYLEKPPEPGELKSLLHSLMEKSAQEPHRPTGPARVLWLHGPHADGGKSKVLILLEEVYGAHFTCRSTVPLEQGTIVEIMAFEPQERRVGYARLVRRQWMGKLWKHYVFEFMGKPDWRNIRA